MNENYKQFFLERREKFDKLFDKKLKKRLKEGFNNSGPVHLEVQLECIKEISEFYEESVWEAAEKAQKDKIDSLKKLLEDSLKELNLLRKDTLSVYDPTLKARIQDAIYE